jgi:hypothetical protein
MLRPKRGLYAPYDPNDPNLLDQGSYVTNQLGPDDPGGDPRGYGDLAVARNASSLFQPSRYPDERALASSRNAVNRLGPGQDPELEKILSMRNVSSLFGGGKGGSSKGPSFAFSSRAPTEQEMLSAQPYDPSPGATNGRMGRRPQSSAPTKDTSQTSSMYQPAASDQPMSTDQQFDRPSEAEASMFRPDSTGPMPDWATRRPDALQQATQSLYAPAQDAGQAPQAGGAPQDQAAAPQRPQTQWEKYGIQPPKVFNPNDPEVGARLGPIDKLSMEQRRTTARYLTEQDRLRASEELKSAQLGEYHEIQKGYYKNQSRMATPYPVETPNGPEWQTHDMVTGEVHNLGPWSPKSQPKDQMAKYVRSVEMVNGKPTVVFRNDNDPSDFKLGGAAAPHEFAPATTTLNFTPAGQPVVYDPRAKTLQSPTWTGAPLPDTTQPGAGGAAAPGAAPSPTAASGQAGAPSAATAPAPASNMPPPGPYTKPGGNTIAPGTLQDLAHAIAPMDETSLSRANEIASMRNDAKSKLFVLARQENPNFNWAEVERKRKMLDNVTNGKDGQNLRSFGVFLDHAAELQDVAKQLQQTNPQILNRPINWFRQNVTSDPLYQRLVAAIEPVNYEYQTFITSGRALYQTERDAMNGMLNGNMPFGQAAAAVNQMGKTALVRYNEIDNSFNRVMKKHLAESTVAGDALSPQAINSAQRIGLDLSGVSGMGGAKFKYTATGANGEKVGSNDGKSWTPIK